MTFHHEAKMEASIQNSHITFVATVCKRFSVTCESCLMLISIQDSPGRSHVAAILTLTTSGQALKQSVFPLVIE